jgi:hypothetical protein
VVLSLVDAPEKSVTFFRRLESHTDRRDIYVNLLNVSRITPDAIALLLSLVRLLGSKRMNVSGNYPADQSAMSTIRESGFDRYIQSSLPRAPRARGAIIRRDFSLDGMTQADGDYAKQLVDFAAKNGGDLLRLKSTYGHLIECMGNTHQHAGEAPGTQPWWASVFHDAGRTCDCFTFVDMGIGIFNSVELSLRLKMLNLIGTVRPNILRELLHGKIPSSTGKGYRGRGLPSIYQSCQDGRIRRLVILTNDVYADASNDVFVAMPDELKGVILYWEVPHERS